MPQGLTLLYLTGCAALWCRHPASGYVQGINDLVTPFLAVFLAEHFESGQSMETWDLSLLAEERILEVPLSPPLTSTYYRPGIERGHPRRCVQSRWDILDH